MEPVRNNEAFDGDDSQGTIAQNSQPENIDTVAVASPPLPELIVLDSFDDSNSPQINGTDDDAPPTILTISQILPILEAAPTEDYENGEMLVPPPISPLSEDEIPENYEPTEDLYKKLTDAPLCLNDVQTNERHRLKNTLSPNTFELYCLLADNVSSGSETDRSNVISISSDDRISTPGDFEECAFKSECPTHGDNLQIDSDNNNNSAEFARANTSPSFSDNSGCSIPCQFSEVKTEPEQTSPLSSMSTTNSFPSELLNDAQACAPSPADPHVSARDVYDAMLLDIPIDEIMNWISSRYTNSQITQLIHNARNRCVPLYSPSVSGMPSSLTSSPFPVDWVYEHNSQLVQNHDCRFDAGNFMNDAEMYRPPVDHWPGIIDDLFWDFNGGRPGSGPQSDQGVQNPMYQPHFCESPGFPPLVDPAYFQIISPTEPPFLDPLNNQIFDRPFPEFGRAEPANSVPNMEHYGFWGAHSVSPTIITVPVMCNNTHAQTGHPNCVEVVSQHEPNCPLFNRPGNLQFTPHVQDPRYECLLVEPMNPDLLFTTNNPQTGGNWMPPGLNYEPNCPIPNADYRFESIPPTSTPQPSPNAVYSPQPSCSRYSPELGISRAHGPGPNIFQTHPTRSANSRASSDPRISKRRFPKPSTSRAHTSDPGISRRIPRSKIPETRSSHSSPSMGYTSESSISREYSSPPSSSNIQSSQAGTSSAYSSESGVSRGSFSQPSAHEIYSQPSSSGPCNPELNVFRNFSPQLSTCRVSAPQANTFNFSVENSRHEHRNDNPEFFNFPAEINQFSPETVSLDSLEAARNNWLAFASEHLHDEPEQDSEDDLQDLSSSDPFEMDPVSSTYNAPNRQIVNPNDAENSSFNGSVEWLGNAPILDPSARPWLPVPNDIQLPIPNNTPPAVSDNGPLQAAPRNVDPTLVNDENEYIIDWLISQSRDSPSDQS